MTTNSGNASGSEPAVILVSIEGNAQQGDGGPCFDLSDDHGIPSNSENASGSEPVCILVTIEGDDSPTIDLTGDHPSEQQQTLKTNARTKGVGKGKAKASPKPKADPKPKASPKVTPKANPKSSPKVSPKANPKPSPKAGIKKKNIPDVQKEGSGSDYIGVAGPSGEFLQTRSRTGARSNDVKTKTHTSGDTNIEKQRKRKASAPKKVDVKKSKKSIPPAKKSVKRDVLADIITDSMFESFPLPSVEVGFARRCLLYPM